MFATDWVKLEVIANEYERLRDGDLDEEEVEMNKAQVVGSMILGMEGSMNQMSRLARDVARKSGKTVELIVTGEDTELDRNVVEEISDPLVHLIRNAIDHGLESPEGRAAASKSSRGRIALKAYHQGGSIVIEISDDGRGLNREKILAKAIERGLLPEGLAPEDLSDDVG